MTLSKDAKAHGQWLSSGDPANFERLVRHYQRPMFGFLARMGFTASEAEDLAQDIFLQLWTKRDRYDRAKGQVSTWL
jgi:RNA polymerase sigma-70 factor (ECF subfamily)